MGYTAKSTFFDFRSGAMVYEGDHVADAVAKGREDLFDHVVEKKSPRQRRHEEEGHGEGE